MLPPPIVPEVNNNRGHTSYTPPDIWAKKHIGLPTHETRPIREEDNPNLSYHVRDGDLRVVLDVTKVVDAETAKAGNRTPSGEVYTRWT